MPLEDAETGLARSTNEPFDLILLDVMLPGGSGFDVCRDLRQRGIKTPIILWPWAFRALPSLF